MPWAYAEPSCKRFDVIVVQCSVFDQPQGPSYRCPYTVPSRRKRRCLGPASKAWSVKCGLRRCGATKVTDILRKGLAHTADRTAINARGYHSSEDESVVSWVPRESYALTEAEVEIACGIVEGHLIYHN